MSEVYFIIKSQTSFYITNDYHRQFLKYVRYI